VGKVVMICFDGDGSMREPARLGEAVHYGEEFQLYSSVAALTFRQFPSVKPQRLWRGAARWFGDLNQHTHDSVSACIRF